MKTRFEKFTNNMLIKLIAREPENQLAWHSFYDRFHKHICLVILRVCKGIGYTDSGYVEDLAQNVYKKLLSSNCKALKDFKAKREVSIYKYLDIIATNVVYNEHTKSNAGKRPPNSRKNSIFQPIKEEANKGLALIDTIRSNESIDEINGLILLEEINYYLDKILEMNKHKDRNKLIFEFSRAGFTPAEIASHPGINVDTKTVGNIISQTKKELKNYLQPANKI